MLDQAFEALTKYDWGTDPAVLKPIDEAVVATHGDLGTRGELENRLTTALTSGVSRDARDYVCRQLRIIGTAACVPVLAKLLAEPTDSHMARYALERMPAPEAAQALRDALPKLTGVLKIGVIASLGARGDVESIRALAALLSDSDGAIARAAAHALGDIGAPAARALATAKAGSDASAAATDASLACAEGLLAEGKKAEALAIYKRFAGADQAKHVRLAATRGMLACAGKTE